MVRNGLVQFVPKLWIAVLILKDMLGLIQEKNRLFVNFVIILALKKAILQITWKKSTMNKFCLSDGLEMKSCSIIFRSIQLNMALNNGLAQFVQRWWKVLQKSKGILELILEKNHIHATFAHCHSVKKALLEVILVIFMNFMWMCNKSLPSWLLILFKIVIKQMFLNWMFLKWNCVQFLSDWSNQT